jgi:hypothetical protein
VIARRLTRDELPAELERLVLTHDLRDGNGRPVLEKGRRLTTADLDALRRTEWRELHVVELEAGDVHEREAGARLATAVAGAGVDVGAFGGGHWPLVATHRGLLRVSRESLRAVNAEGALSVYTLLDGQVVDAGETIARAKIVPFCVPAAVLVASERTARSSGGVVGVTAFRHANVGAVVQESLGSRAMARFRDALAEKVEWFGSTLLEPEFVAAEAGAIATALDALARAGAQLLIIAGSRAMDPLDPAFEALGGLGAAMVRHGVPAHPGSLFWIAEHDRRYVVGMPSCGLFSKATVFDLVLPRILAGECITSESLAELGHGGLLTRDMAFRFPPYRPTRGRGEVE